MIKLCIRSEVPSDAVVYQCVLFSQTYWVTIKCWITHTFGCYRRWKESKTLLIWILWERKVENSITGNTSLEMEWSESVQRCDRSGSLFCDSAMDLKSITDSTVVIDKIMKKFNSLIYSKQRTIKSALCCLCWLEYYGEVCYMYKVMMTYTYCWRKTLTAVSEILVMMNVGEFSIR